MDAAALRYYESLSGDWTGIMQMRVIDESALRRADWFTRTMGLFVRWSGRVRLSTTLRRGPDGAAGPVFEHTTRVTRWGVPMLRSAERIMLLPGGRSAEMQGVHRVTGRPDEPYRGTVEISADAQAANYRFDWMGAPMSQRTQVVADGLRLSQETAWMASEVLLRRVV